MHTHYAKQTFNGSHERSTRPPLHEKFITFHCHHCKRELLAHSVTRFRAWCARCQAWRTKGATDA